MNFGGQQRFQGNWSFWEVFSTLKRMGFWLIRGTVKKLFFGKAGKLVFVGPNVKIYHSRQMHCGNNFIAERGCEINCISENGLHFGEKVTIGSYALIRPGNIYGGPKGHGLRIGNYSNIGPYAYIGCSGDISIGDNVMISPRVSIYSENHNFDQSDELLKDQGITRSYCKIEDDCWIAANSIILAGVTVGKGSVVAAGSVVTKDIPPYAVVAGNPARILKNRRPEENPETIAQAL